MFDDNEIEELTHKLESWTHIREDGERFFKRQIEQINSIILMINSDFRRCENNKYIMLMVNDSINRLNRMKAEVSALSVDFYHEVMEKELVIKEEISRLTKDQSETTNHGNQ